MKVNSKTILILTWTARILSGLVLAIGLPFYFGYGNPLQFIDPEYRLWDNLWLSIFLLMFTGLMLGWKLPRAGGYLVAVPVTTGLIAGLVMEQELIIHMLVPLVSGCLFVISGYLRLLKHDIGTT